MLRALVAAVCLLALGLPVLAQDADAKQAKRIEELIEQLALEFVELLEGRLAPTLRSVEGRRRPVLCVLRPSP